MLLATHLESCPNAPEDTHALARQLREEELDVGKDKVKLGKKWDPKSLMESLSLKTAQVDL